MESEVLTVDLLLFTLAVIIALLVSVCIAAGFTTLLWYRKPAHVRLDRSRNPPFHEWSISCGLCNRRRFMIMGSEVGAISAASAHNARKHGNAPVEVYK